MIKREKEGNEFFFFLAYYVLHTIRGITYTSFYLTLKKLYELFF